MFISLFIPLIYLILVQIPAMLWWQLTEIISSRIIVALKSSIQFEIVFVHFLLELPFKSFNFLLSLFLVRLSPFGLILDALDFPFEKLALLDNLTWHFLNFCCHLLQLLVLVCSKRRVVSLSLLFKELLRQSSVEPLFQLRSVARNDWGVLFVIYPTTVFWKTSASCFIGQRRLIKGLLLFLEPESLLILSLYLTVFLFLFCPFSFHSFPLNLSFSFFLHLFFLLQIPEIIIDDFLFFFPFFPFLFFKPPLLFCQVLNLFPFLLLLLTLDSFLFLFFPSLCLLNLLFELLLYLLFSLLLHQMFIYRLILQLKQVTSTFAVQILQLLVLWIILALLHWWRLLNCWG